MSFLALYILARLFWRARETLMKQDHRKTCLFPLLLSNSRNKHQKTHPCDCIISLPLHPYVASYNSLGPRGYGFNSKWVIFKHKLVTDILSNFSEIATRWMAENPIVNIVQVMVWCRQAAIHYLNNVELDIQCHMASLGHNGLSTSHHGDKE